MNLSVELKQATVITALNAMVRRGYLDICTIDKCAEILSIQLRGFEPYRLLSALHCVHFAEMPTQVRNEIPFLIGQCLRFDVFPVFTEPKREQPETEPKRGFWYRLLGAEREAGS